MTWWIVRGGGDVVDAWIGGTIAYAIQAAVMYGRFRSNAWQKIDIFRGDAPETA